MMSSVSGDDTADGAQCDTGPLVTVVVPVLRDAEALEPLLASVFAPGGACVGTGEAEWVVVNGDAGDVAMAAVRRRFPGVRWLDAPPGRGPQQNAGAAVARGRWLLFLHADSQLPAGWREEVTLADRAASKEWGCFRLAIDSAAWQARLIERLVRLRVALLGLPYGDQGLFVRRDVFDAVGGFPSVPLMEDVALVRKLQQRGRPWRASLAVRTSARRWERDGWFRRSARNLWLLGRYLLGAPPERLVAAYERSGRQRSRRQWL
jgi:rSAM/selenodomain-associated transferase 2